jgi:uncharacterized Zn finger protein
MSLTERQKKEYLQDPNRCPSCKSEDIETVPKMPGTDADYLWRYVECNTCGLYWKDIYKLITIAVEE